MALLCADCVARQPDRDRTVAAIEVPLHAGTDREVLLNLLRTDAASSGFHVDAATDEELRINSEVSPITFKAAVWRGRDDDEIIASAMDEFDHIGRVWITFARGQDQQRSALFRRRLMQDVTHRWPDTLSLSIMPSGAIPLSGDLIRTQTGYQLSCAAAAKYRVGATPVTCAAAR